MSDYIPTTEDIKYAYAHWKGQEPEFDRWLAEVKADAWDEGYVGGFTVAITLDASTLDNPYRHGEEQ